jgi:hypothetical protein
MSDLSLRDAIVDVLASNIDGEVGMCWYPTGQPTDRAYVYADALVQLFEQWEQ